MCYKERTEQWVVADDKTRRKAVVILNPDGSLVREPGSWRSTTVEKQIYYTELPRHCLDEQSSLMEQLIAYAFDVIGAHHIEVRVVEPE